jgi:hypothetical protein
LQTQQRVRDDISGSRYKRSPTAETGNTMAQEWILKADQSQKEFLHSSQKMGDSLKNIENMISETIVKRRQEHQVIFTN